ncbi:MAG: permease [Theionarchaea archaeon]|nr:permease [Theionarchaea archaeon]
MDILIRALESGVAELLEYFEAHVVTCLVPAFFIAGAIAVFISKQSILKYFGVEARKYVSYTVASISGCILAACSCTVIPLFAGIYKRGAGIGPATAFLYSGPAINILAIVFTARVLGLEIGLARGISAVVMAVIIGFVMAFIYKDEERKEVNLKMMDEPDNLFKKIVFFLNLILILVVGASTLNNSVKWIAGSGLLITLALITVKWQTKSDTQMWFKETWNLSKMIFPYLVIGVFAAGIIKEFLPPEYVSQYVGGNSVSANAIASFAGALMYFATLTEVPIVESLMSLGMGKGPELALLLAGPALSLPNMLAINQVLGIRKTLTYIWLVIGFATLSGLIYGGIP